MKLPPKARALYRAVERDFFAELGSGEIRADIVPQQAACLLIAAVQGLALRWVLTGGERFALSEQADIVTTTLLEGWTPRA